MAVLVCLNLRRNMAKNHQVIYKYLITALVACALCFLFPYTHDDWAWGSVMGLRRLANWFDNYNGRYLGNFIVLALTRSRMLRAVVMSITFTGIMYCIERITRRRWAYTIALLGLLLLPRYIFIQTVVWTSGFANYSTSAFLTLIFLVYLNEHKPDESCSVSFMTGVFLAVLGVCNTLIVEHMTFFHVVLSVFLFIYGIRTTRRIRKDYLIYMIGCVAGAVCMFSNSVFHTIVSNPNSYYHIASGGIVYQALKNYFGMIYHEGFYNNHFVNIMLCAASFLLYRQYKKNQPRKDLLSKVSICMIIMTVCLICSLITFVLYGYSYIDYDHLPKVGIEGCLSFVSLFAAIALTLITTYKDGLNKKLVFLWLSFIVMIAPLFAVSPIGPRCFISSYIFLILIICEAFKCISSEPAEIADRFQKYAAAISSVLIILSAGFYFRVYRTVYHAENLRIQHINEEITAGSKTIELSHLPYEEWIWRATPTKDNDIWEDRFKLFYGIPQDVDEYGAKFAPPTSL